MTLPSEFRRIVTANCGNLQMAGPDETDGLLEFVDLYGRGVKIETSTAAGHQMAVIMTGTEVRLIEAVAEGLDLPMETVREIASVLGTGAFLCGEMAQEVVRALQAFLALPPPTEVMACRRSAAERPRMSAPRALDDVDEAPAAMTVRPDMGMTVDDLREAIAGLPGDRRVVIPRGRGENYSPAHSAHPMLFGEPDGADRRIWLTHAELDEQIADPAGLYTEEDRAPAGAEMVVLLASVD